jgi:hypothetical protein
VSDSQLARYLRRRQRDVIALAKSLRVRWGIWLVSVGTTVSLLAALVGAALAVALIDLSRPVAAVIGAAAGWVLSSLVLGAPADRLDRRLHRMGGGRVFRRRRR